jgi:tRNA pseudouridine65 synthase
MTALHILWRDEHLVAVYKPAGWLVHRTGLDAGETRFVMQTLRDQLGQHVYPVHRLDKGTCGVLVMALHSAAARACRRRLSTGRRTSATWPWCAAGRPKRWKWTMPSSPTMPRRMPPCSPPTPAFSAWHSSRCPRPATARFATTRASLVEAVPTTGRRHQIRRHLKHLAHPIIGDATHGKGPINRWWADRLGQQSGCGCTPGS